jgi:hypothetical protein
MKTKDIIIIAAIAAAGWYFYRTSKGLPLIPSGIVTAPGTAAPTATAPPSTSSPLNPTTIAGYVGDASSILSGLTTAAGDLGINSSSTADTSNAGIDDLQNTV